jgi:hypothetical protein
VDVFGWRRFCAAASMAAFLHVCQAPVSGQQTPLTADQVIAKYIEAIGGADKITSITTFAEKGEFTGNLNTFGRHFVSPTAHKDRESFEFYFKAPNLRSALTLTESGMLAGAHGCNGMLAWYVGPDGHRSEFKPRPGNEGDCKDGYELLPLTRRAPNLKIQMKGEKKIGDQMAWEIRVQDPNLEGDGTYYFDAKTYLLIRKDAGAVKRSYSDYRDVGGLRIPFTVTRSADTNVTTTLREVEINTQLDEARFEGPASRSKPQDKQAPIVHPPAPAPPPVQTGNAEVPAVASSVRINTAPSARYVNAVNFVSSSILEIQEAVPELKGLRASSEQQELPQLLDKVGAMTVDLSRKIPNLISKEEVSESQPGSKISRQHFSYLTLAHRGQDSVTLEEFRVDLQSGAMLQSDDISKPDVPGSPRWDDLAQASQRASARQTGAPPLTQGFASMWLRFYPSNRSESSFRCLGRQKIDRHQTFVLAFSQKPASVRLPAEVRFKEKSVPVFYQGIAWVDASDYRIVRLRTDLLSPISDLPLTQLTAEVEFANTQAAGFDTLLWLPREVDVTSQVNGLTFHDKHIYSNYRSFQVHTKILLDR